MNPLTSLRPRVWWIAQHELDDYILHSEPFGTHASSYTKVHDSAYVELLERIVERYAMGIEWLMPKVHQGNHEGELSECPKAICIEYRTLLTSVQQMCEEFKGG